MITVDAKEYSWEYVTLDNTLLTSMACELVYARLTPDTAAAAASIFNGENENGQLVGILRTAELYNCEIAPPVPIYCRRGLYIDALTTGAVLIIWRNRPSPEG